MPLQHKIFVTKQIPQSGRGPATRWQHADVVADHVHTDHGTTRRRAGRSSAHHNAGGRGRRLGRGIGTTTAADLHHPRSRGPLVRRNSVAAEVPRRHRAGDRRDRRTDGGAERSASSAPTSGIGCSPGRYPPATWTCPSSTSGVSSSRVSSLVPVEVGHTDTEATTMLHVPDRSVCSWQATSSTTGCTCT